MKEAELIANAGSTLPLAKTAPARSKVLAVDDLDIFGLEMAADISPKKTKAPAKTPAAKKAAAKPRRPNASRKRARSPQA